jgi:YD repeat-containing protein
LDQLRTCAYDAAGNRTRVDDSFGGVTTSTFDAVNRLSARELGGSGIAPMRAEWAYMAVGTVKSFTQRGWDGSAFTTAGATTYAYDAADRLTSQRRVDGAGTQRALYTYSYDAADRVASQTIDGTTTAYAYDLAGQLTQAGAATFGYDANGNRMNAGYVTSAGNRVVSDGTNTYTYDAAGSVVGRSGPRGVAGLYAASALRSPNMSTILYNADFFFLCRRFDSATPSFSIDKSGEIVIDGNPVYTGLPIWPACADLIIDISTKAVIGLSYQVPPHRISLAIQLICKLVPSSHKLLQPFDIQMKNSYGEEYGEIGRLEFYWQNSSESSIAFCQLSEPFWLYSYKATSDIDKYGFIGIGISNYQQFLIDNHA